MKSTTRIRLASVTTLSLTMLVSGFSSVPSWASTSVASDGFDRTVTSGWGSAPTGGAWTSPTGTSSSSVSGSQAVINVPAGHESRTRLSSTSVQDADISTSVLVPSGVAAYAGVDARIQSNLSAYRARVYVSASGTAQVQVRRIVPGSADVQLCAASVPGTVTAGQKLDLETSVSGTSAVTLKARVHVDGASVPDWQATCTDSSSSRISAAGQVGIQVYSDTAATYRFDSFAASAAAQVSTTSGPGQAATTAGAASVGSANYTVPSGALYVSTTGNDSSAGSQSAPLRTIAAAVSKASSGATIVVEGGTYHESLTLPSGKALTVQNAPGAAVWLDGSTAVTGFTQSGSTWVKNDWTTQFDSSPTFVRGAADGAAPYWQFVNPDHPMAAHPDQVWVGGNELTQVSSASAVVAGTFYVDYANHQLVIGNDPAAGVQASTLNRAVSFLGADSTMRGIGIRNYADSVPDMGVIDVYATGITLENLSVLNSATTGVGVFRAGAALRHLTIDHSGLMGVHATEADAMTLDGLRITNSNTELFNATPAAGGIKISTSRTVTLSNSLVSNTTGNAVWTDDSSYDIAIVKDVITANTGRGVFLELSQKASVVGNVITDNGGDQIRVGNTAQAQIWNNTVSGTSVALHICQDSRTPSNASYAVDKRRPSPDPDMTWVITGTTVGNNVFQATGSITSLVLVEDYTRARAASAMISAIDGDGYVQPVSGQPAWLIGWARAGADPAVYTTLAAFRTAQSSEAHGWSVSGSSVVTSSTGTLTGAPVSSTGVTLPSDVATRASIDQEQEVGAL